jgi:hypothetical protein
VRERLEWARAEAQRRASIPARPPLRLRLGALLVALGHRLLQQAPTPHRATS